MSAISIYSVPQVAQLTVAGVHSGAKMITHSAYNRSTFKIFRRAANNLDFLLRDIDRQPVVLDGVLTFHLWDSKGNSLVEQPLAVVNAARGHYRLTLSAASTIGLTLGIYVWSVSSSTNDTPALLYTNTDYETKGIAEVSEGIITPADEPIIIMADDLTPLAGQLQTGALAGAARADNPSGNHTLVAHLLAYTGDIIVEASLDLSTPTSQDWAEVARETLSTRTGPVVLNFDGNYTYVRFRFTDVDGVEKLVYRN
jgi:hypothetical protein